MTITVIGHLCLDVIHHPDNSSTQSYGGIFFSVTALANLLPEGSSVAPVFGIGKADYDALIERLSHYPNVDRSGIYKFNGPTNHVSLFYKNISERIECSEHIAEPVPMKRIAPYLRETDLVLVNMISGFDVTLETLDEIRMEVRDKHIPIYLDVHSLTLDIADNHTRFHRPIDRWRRWMFMLHAAQMNEDEARILTPEKLDELSLAKHTLALNTKALIITRAARGCTAFIDEHKTVRRIDVAGLDGATAVDATGCGDVFGAAYCANYVASGDVAASVQFANQVAALKAHLPGSSEIDRLSTFRIANQTAVASAQKP
jgi:sugar/nucleoside kinase (ribokinase family)